MQLVAVTSYRLHLEKEELTAVRDAVQNALDNMSAVSPLTGLEWKVKEREMLADFIVHADEMLSLNS